MHLRLLDRRSTLTLTWVCVHPCEVADNNPHNYPSHSIIATNFLKYPVVLIHGFSDTASVSGSWKVVENLLGDMGIEFYTPDIPPLGSIEERSASLIRQISAKYPGKTVHLFGHSMVLMVLSRKNP